LAVINSKFTEAHNAQHEKDQVVIDDNGYGDDG